MLIDCHVHRPGRTGATYEMLDEQRVVAREHGVGAWIVNGSTVEDSREVLEYVKGREGYFACVGVHPMRSDTFDDKTIEQVAELASNPQVVGIGEVGIDFARSELPHETQINAFRQQIRLARELKLPLNLHIYGKESGQALTQILKEEKAWEVGGVLHNFMGSDELAHKLLDLGIYPSVSVVIMHPEAHRLRGVYNRIPLGGLVMDTDWPAGLLERNREEQEFPHDLDQKTELVNLYRFAERLAEIKEESVEHVCEMIMLNTLRAFPKLSTALGRG